MAISNSTLRTDVWQTVRDALTSSLLYVTNSTTLATSAASVAASYNDKSYPKPLVIIKPINVDETLNKFGSTEGQKFVYIDVSCYADQTLYVDQLSDQVANRIKSNIPKEMELIALSEDNAFINPNLSKYHMRTITFTFDKE